MPLKTLNNRADLLRCYQHHANDSDAWQESAKFLGYEYHQPINLSSPENEKLVKEESQKSHLNT